MVRLCERPGCSQPGDVAYGIDAGHLTVWIQALDPAAPGMPGVLCRRHADAMVVPLRWTLDDRREPVPRLFRSPATAESPPKERPQRRPAVASGTQLGLDDDERTDRSATEGSTPDAAPGERHRGDASRPGATTAGAATAGDADAGADAGTEAPDPAAGVEPWKPVFDPDDDLGGLLTARSPLLSRAFQGRERRRGD
jgi:hypothetical protein